MKKYMASLVGIVVAALTLTGCSSEGNKASSLSTPTGFVKVSTDGGKFEFSSLVDGKNNVEFDTVCNDLFDWAEDNGFARYTLVENTFELSDYEAQGRPISKTRSDDAPWVSGCGGNIERLEEKGPNASLDGPNKNRIAAFFGIFDEGSIKGYAFLTVAFKDGEKYLTLAGEFASSEATDSPSTIEPSESVTPTETSEPSKSPEESPSPSDS